MTEKLAAGLGEGVKGLVAKWRNRATSIYAMFPGDQAAERIEICALELETALEAAARLPAERVLDEQPFFFAIETAGGDWHDGEYSVFGDRVEAQDRADDLNEELPEAEWYRVVPLYRVPSSVPVGEQKQEEQHGEK